MIFNFQFPTMTFTMIDLYEIYEVPGILSGSTCLLNFQDISYWKSTRFCTKYGQEKLEIEIGLKSGNKLEFDNVKEKETAAEYLESWKKRNNIKE